MVVDSETFVNLMDFWFFSMILVGNLDCGLLLVSLVFFWGGVGGLLFLLRWFNCSVGGLCHQSTAVLRLFTVLCFGFVSCSCWKD